MVMDQMRNFQESVRGELGQVNRKVHEMESSILDIRVMANQKASGEEVRDIIDRKLQAL